VEVSKPATTVANTAQRLVKTGREAHDKRDTLRRLIRSAEGLTNAIIFCNRKREVATLHRSLVSHGFSAIALHGDMDQSARTAALEQFRRGEIKLLVASDVAARGLDIPAVSHVFNFDVPHHPDDYVHRIGRTGRAGRTGTAITIVAPADGKAVAAIEKLTGQTIEWAGEPAPSTEPGDEHPRERTHSRPPRRERSGERPQREARSHQARPSQERPSSERPSQERQSQARPGQERVSAERVSPERVGQERVSQEPPSQGRPAPQRTNHERPSRERPSQERAPAKVAHLDEARSRRPASQPVVEEGDHSHLPAFLLRPVTLKA
jgi:superfamily II DNA/RNA helicase